MKDITHEFARSFAEEWVASWNSHDIESILSHYSENFTVESRIAAKLVPDSKGLIVGKAAIKSYWTLGLQRNPLLEFKILDVLFGVAGLTVYYENTANGLRAVEIMLFNEEEEVQKVIVHHSEFL